MAIIIQRRHTKTDAAQVFFVKALAFMVTLFGRVPSKVVVSSFACHCLLSCLCAFSLQFADFIVFCLSST